MKPLYQIFHYFKNKRCLPDSYNPQKGHGTVLDKTFPLTDVSFMEQWPSGSGTGFPIQRSRIQNH